MSDVCKDATDVDSTGRVFGQVKEQLKQCTSEDSNLSDASAEDSQIFCSFSTNCKVPRKDLFEVTKNNCCSPNNNNNQSLIENASEMFERDSSEMTSNEKAPSFEDICMKDARTLNTNVQLLEEATQISTDSEKFHKPLNINRNEITEASEKSDAALAGCSNLGDYFDDVVPQLPLELKVLESNIMDLCKKGGDFKNVVATCKIKETNILADMCSNQKHPEGKKLFLDLDHPDINNIKRIKIDDDGRQTKVNIVQNLPERETEKEGRSSSQRSREDEDEESPSPPAEDLESQLTRQAQESWVEYTRSNKSIIVDTFQGQFKNTLNCSACNHTSVTFEPFMFLSLPIPRATQLQLPIIFLTNCGLNAVRYVVTVDKNSTIAHLKKELNSLLFGTSKLLIAEVHLFSIISVLDDQVSVKNIDTKHQLYAFEDSAEELPGDLDASRLRQSSNCSSPFLPNVEDGSLPSSIQGIHDFDEDPVPTCDDTSYETERFEIGGRTMATDYYTTLNNSNNSFTNVSANEIKLQLNPDINWQHNELDDSMQMLTDTTLTWSSKKCTNANWRQQTADWVNNSQIYDKSEEDIYSRDGLDEDRMNVLSEDKMSSASTAAVGFESGNREMGGRTGTCAICLEEMPLCSLKIHLPCGGTLCSECLEMSFKHASFCLKCPVCRCSVTPKHDFVQVDSSTDDEPRLENVTLHVMFRWETRISEDQICYNLFGHPSIIKLPNHLPGHSLHDALLRMVPSWSTMKDYTVVLTNSKGLQCSRCSHSKFCSGCPLNRSEAHLILRQGDHLVLHYTDMTQEEVQLAGEIVDDGTASDSRLQSPVSLLECLQSFMKSELLDRHNPWYCPTCKENQCAKRTMTVWKYPDTLIIQLKRFEFHNQLSTKIDSKVIYPITDLDLSRHVSNPGDVPLLYDLQSYVCHDGGVNCGHYIAFTKHPLSGEWYGYDDTKIKRQNPSQCDHARAYVLFYQRKNTSVSFELPKELASSQERSSSSCSSNSSLLKRGRTSSGSDLRKPAHHDFLDDIRY